jgi:hypothetical protein
MKQIVIRVLLSAAVILTALAGIAPQAARGQSNSRFFPQTNHTVQGRFLDYWNTHGGLAQQGYPLSDELEEISGTDGKPYRVQYFERAIFEYHPENATPYDVLLTLLGVFRYRQQYGPAGGPDQHVNPANSRLFPETGYHVGGDFRTYWEQHGGLAQQGYPISEEFTEVSPLDGKLYTVQYFQRAVFERHPEHAGTPYEVLLSQLGTFRYQARTTGIAIPAPGPGRVQYALQAAGPYLIWKESRGQFGDQVDLRALDTRTNRLIFVADVKGEGSDPSASGSLVVWQHVAACAPDCGTNDILGKDLATGASYTIATGLSDRTAPVVSGRRVAWQTTSDTELWLKDIDTGALMRVAALPPYGGTYLTYPVLTDRYLAWILWEPRTEGEQHYTVQVYDLATQTTRTLADRTIRSASQNLHLAVSGERLVWSDPAAHLADLTTGAITDLPVEYAADLTIQGDTVLWSAKGAPNATDLDIWGMRLLDSRPLLLASAPGNQQRPAVAGDWLAWQTQGGPQDGRLGAARLADAFLRPDAPPLTPPVTAGLITTTVRRAAWGAGHYLFWADSSYPYTRLYGYDLNTGHQWLLTEHLSTRYSVASDGQIVAWVESEAGNSVASYNLNTGTASTIIPPGEPDLLWVEGIAVDSGTLYYTANTRTGSGLFARPVTGGPPTQLRSGRVLPPMAAGGNVLWAEEEGYGGKQVHYTSTLHLRTPATPPEGVVLPAGSLGFGGYDVSADYVAWTDAGPSGALHLYTIAGGAQQELATDATMPRIRGNQVAWSEAPGYGRFGGSVWTYNIATIATRLIAGGQYPEAAVVALLDGPAVAYTVGQGSLLDLRLYAAPLPAP